MLTIFELLLIYLQDSLEMVTSVMISTNAWWAMEDAL